MALWDKLRTELDRAGRAAQDALDEGRIRLDAFRARQQADKAAQAIGYAVFRARQEGTEADPAAYAKLSTELAAHEAEAARLESQLVALGARRKGKSSPSTSPTDGATGATGARPTDASAGANI